MKKVWDFLNKHPYIVLLTPFLVLSMAFLFIPIINSFYISFFDFSFLNPSNRTFVLFDNFKNLFGDEVFITSLKNTATVVLVFVPAQLFLALFVAMLVSAKIRAKGFFRVLIYLPYIVSPIAVGAIVTQLFKADTPLVTFLTNFGFENVTWNATRPYAFWLIVLLVIWTQIGFFMVIYHSALKEIPEDLYEAAEVDGATSVQKFRFITFPMLKHTRFLVMLMSTIVAFQLFELPYLISTIGGTSPGTPGNSTMTIVMYVYTNAFRYNNMGIAAAAGVVLFTLIFTLSYVQNKLQGKGE